MDHTATEALTLAITSMNMLAMTVTTACMFFSVLSFVSSVLGSIPGSYRSRITSRANNGFFCIGNATTNL